MLTIAIAAGLALAAVVATAVWMRSRRRGRGAPPLREQLGDVARLPGRLRRVASDPRTPRRARWWLAGIVVYLASPIDVIPDFIPVLGQLDDLVVASLALRHVKRMIPQEVWREHFTDDHAAVERQERD